MNTTTPDNKSRTVRLAAAALLAAALLIPGPPAWGAADAPARIDSTAADDAIPVEFYLKSARTACRNQQWEIAEMEYQNVLLRESTNLDAILELADVYERLGKYEHARGLLSRASALDSNNKKLIKRALELDRKLCASLHSEVDTLMAQESYELALPKLALLLTLEPENPDLYYQKSLCHYHLSRYDIALATIETALRLRGEMNYHDLHQLIINRMKQAEIHSLMQRAATVISPDSESERQSALTLLARIIELDPDNGWAKQEFLRLSEYDAPAPKIRETARSGIRSVIARSGIAAGTAFVLLGESLSNHLEILLILLAILLLLHSPLTRSLMKGLPHHLMLSGDLSRFKITEILMMISSHDYTGSLVIKGKSISGTIYFEHGDAYHCIVGRAAGKEAFRSILNQAHSGRFYFTETRPPVQRTIDIPLSLLIMDLPERSPAANPLQPRKRVKSKISELLENR